MVLQLGAWGRAALRHEGADLGAAQNGKLPTTSATPAGEPVGRQAELNETTARARVYIS